MKLSDLLARSSPPVDVRNGWQPSVVASFVPWKQQKPEPVQKVFAETRFVPAIYEQTGPNPDVWCLQMGLSFGTGYSYYAAGSEHCVRKLTLRLEGIEAAARAAELPAFIELATNLTRKATGADMPKAILDRISDPGQASSDYSSAEREIAASGHGFNFSDFASVAREPHFRSLVFEVFAPALAEDWAR